MNNPPRPSQCKCGAIHSDMLSPIYCKVCVTFTHPAYVKK